MELEKIFKTLSWFKKIEVLRIINGWSQEEAAEKCGTSKRIYWNWENGKSQPRKINKKYIATAFGIDAKEIFSPKVGNENANKSDSR